MAGLIASISNLADAGAESIVDITIKKRRNVWITLVGVALMEIGVNLRTPMAEGRIEGREGIVRREIRTAKRVRSQRRKP